MDRPQGSMTGAPLSDTFFFILYDIDTMFVFFLSIRYSVDMILYRYDILTSDKTFFLGIYCSKTFF